MCVNVFETTSAFFAIAVLLRVLLRVVLCLLCLLRVLLLYNQPKHHVVCGKVMPKFFYNYHVLVYPQQQQLRPRQAANNNNNNKYPTKSKAGSVPDTHAHVTGNNHHSATSAVDNYSGQLLGSTSG